MQGAAIHGQRATRQAIRQRAGARPQLFDLNAADDRWRGPRRRANLHAWVEFCRLFFFPDVAPNFAEGLTKYFLEFAVNARGGVRVE